MAMERLIPTIPQHKAILFASDKYTAGLKRKLSRESTLDEEPQKRDGILRVDSENSPFVNDPRLAIFDSLYLGTKNSASNKIPDLEYKISIGIAAQLNLGVRFLDFEITTFDCQLWIVCGNKLAMLGAELFNILKVFVDQQSLAGNTLKEKILLNFREHSSGMSNLMPTWELLSNLILKFFVRENPLTNYVVPSYYSKVFLRDMVGVFIIFAPDDLNLALDDEFSHLNWGSDFIEKVTPNFNGSNDCILQWANMQEIRNYEDFPPVHEKLVWLDISDPGYKGTARHEIQSLEDGKLLYPIEKSRFNIISFGSLGSTDVIKFLKNAPKSKFD